MKEDVLEQTPTAQKWIKKGEERARKKLEAKAEEAKKKYEADIVRIVETQRQTLLAIVLQRFPEQVPVAQKLVKDVSDPVLLSDVTVNISAAPDPEKALVVLAKLAS